MVYALSNPYLKSAIKNAIVPSPNVQALAICSVASFNAVLVVLLAHLSAILVPIFLIAFCTNDGSTAFFKCFLAKLQNLSIISDFANRSNNSLIPFTRPVSLIASPAAFNTLDIPFFAPVSVTVSVASLAAVLAKFLLSAKLAAASPPRFLNHSVNPEASLESSITELNAFSYSEEPRFPAEPITFAPAFIVFFVPPIILPKSPALGFAIFMPLSLLTSLPGLLPVNIPFLNDNPAALAVELNKLS